jgi:hypothetical protein
LSHYLFLTQFFVGTPEVKILQPLIDKCQEFGLKVLKAGAPYLIPFFYQFGIAEYGMVANWITHLFARKFPDHWRLWYWTFREREPLKVFAAFITAVAILALPEIIKGNHEAGDILGKWDLLAQTVQLKEAMNFTKFLLCSVVDDDTSGF